MPSSLKVGIQLPSTTIGQDPADITRFTQSAESAGFHHVALGEHILWAVPGDGDARSTSTYLDVLTTLAYLAAVTSTIELFPAVFVMPQRQAQLVAKQCAQVDILSNGRLRVSVGVGSLTPEYDALGGDFHHRGAIMDEQIAVMRALWSNDWAEFHGRYHDIAGATLGIRPIQRPIPVWIGGGSDAALARAGRLGDGWIATARTENLDASVGKIHAAAKAAGRDPTSVGIQGRIFLENKTPDDWRAELAGWQSVNATYVDIRDGGLSPDDHLAQAQRFLTETGLAP
jgi:probable F420-dependent oxidoreductase